MEGPFGSVWVLGCLGASEVLLLIGFSVPNVLVVVVVVRRGDVLVWLCMSRCGDCNQSFVGAHC